MIGLRVNKMGQTDRSSGRKRHMKLLIEDNRDNDQERNKWRETRSARGREREKEGEKKLRRKENRYFSTT